MKKNYWPVAIVGIILFGVLSSRVGVVIAIKNPAIDEEMYGGKKRDIDERINSILQEQNEFESSAKAFLQMGEENLVLQTPYRIKAPKKSFVPPKFALPLSLRLEIQSPIYIHSVKLIITSFMQDVPDSNPIAFSTKNGQIYTPDSSLAFAKDGRYKLRFEIQYSQNRDTPPTKTAYFEQEIFYASNAAHAN